MRPDSVKFSQFGPNINDFGIFLKVYLIFGQIYAIGQILIGVNGQILKNSVVIRSHWQSAKISPGILSEFTSKVSLCS